MKTKFNRPFEIDLRVHFKACTSSRQALNLKRKLLSGVGAILQTSEPFKSLAHSVTVGASLMEVPMPKPCEHKNFFSIIDGYRTSIGACSDCSRYFRRDFTTQNVTFTEVSNPFPDGIAENSEWWRLISAPPQKKKRPGKA